MMMLVPVMIVTQLTQVLTGAVTFTAKVATAITGAAGNAAANETAITGGTGTGMSSKQLAYFYCSTLDWC